MNDKERVCPRLPHDRPTSAPMAKTPVEPTGPARTRAAASHPASRNGERIVYSFGKGRADGDGSMKAILGGKGANLAEMTRLGLPVPPGFTIGTPACAQFAREGGELS